MTKLEQLANEIALFVYPKVDGDDEESSLPREGLAGTIMELALLAGTIMELALEIKRATTEGEW